MWFLIIMASFGLIKIIFWGPVGRCWILILDYYTFLI